MLGILLFLSLAGYVHIWFAGGIIGLIMAALQPDKNNKFTVGLAVLSAIPVFAGGLFVLEVKTSAENLAGYALSASLFSGVFLYAAGQRTTQKPT